MPYGVKSLKRKLILATCAVFLTPISGVAQDRITIAALGDSLTQGYGLPAEEGFVPQLQRWLTENGAGDVVLINAGVSGDTTAGGLARVDWTLTPEVDAVMVILGGNDLLRGIDPTVSRSNIDGILSKISERGLPVLLAGMPAPGNYGLEYRVKFNAIYPSLAREYGAILYPNFMKGLGPGNDLSRVAHLMQRDGIHPNEEGVVRIVNAIGPHVLELIENARAQ